MFFLICLIFSKPIPGHIQNLDKVLGALVEAGLVLMCKKWAIARKEVKCLGTNVKEFVLGLGHRFTLLKRPHFFPSRRFRASNAKWAKVRHFNPPFSAKVK